MSYCTRFEWTRRPVLCLSALVIAIACCGRVLADDSKPADAPKAAENAKPADEKKPAEKPKPDEAAKKEEQKPAEKPKPEETPKKDEASKKDEPPKKEEPAKPAEKPKAEETSKKDDAPKKDEAPKKEEAAKPAEAPKPQEAPKKDDAAKKDEPPKKEAEPAKPVDPDFALQGEFRGSVTVSKSRSQVVGLQIRPLGNGRFDAAQYLGGLPGERRGIPAPTLLIGKRNEQFVTLSGGPWAVLAHPDHCWLVDREGNRVGSLERVERKSPTLGAKPPANAIVLFDGTGTDQFSPGQMTEDGLLMEGADLRPMFQDFNLHLEFKLPYMPTASGQGRSNSGVYLQSRYEVQILDSFGLDPANNDCGALYTFRRPDVNMCLPPLVWQTYDIMFTSPRWASDGTKLHNARVTVWLNGVKVHDNVELANKTGAGKEEEPLLLPIRLQNHKNPVRFRNIWLIDRGLLPARDFPPLPKGKKG